MMRKQQPLFIPVSLIAIFLGLLIIANIAPEKDSNDSSTPTTYFKPITSSFSSAFDMKPIVDFSGWQVPNKINYDTLASSISGAILRVQSGSHTKKDNASSYAGGRDKYFDTHAKELQKRHVPIAVYAYAIGKNTDEMKKEAQTFYDYAQKYHPTYYWIDVEEKSMDDMDKGVTAFKEELERLGAKNIGLYSNAEFIKANGIDTSKFSAVWLADYGVTDSGVYGTPPNATLDYDLHQYTASGTIGGISSNVPVDLNVINPEKDPNAVYKKLFGHPQ